MDTFTKFFAILCLCIFYFLLTSWQYFYNLSDSHMTLEAQVDMLTGKKDELLRKILNLEREEHRLQLKVEKLDYRARELLPLAKNRLKLPTIFFVTPTARRPSQKADLTRLAQTLAHVSNLYWVIVEDVEKPSGFINDILKRSRLSNVHLTAQTPKRFKMNETDPNWKLPRGVIQRNTALQWIRTNFAGLSRGIIYFGDDDNTYDWRLFDEIRSVRRIGVWPVGLVGSLLVETPLLHKNLTFAGFNAVWKPERAFPIDMAGFAVNISLILANKKAVFTYDSPRGYQESHFLKALNLNISDLEPKADLLSKVYVWHTRTEKTKLITSQRNKFLLDKDLSYVEADAIH